MDAQGEYPRAADLLRQANALRLELNRGRRPYCPAEHEQFVDNVIRVFDRKFFARVAGAGNDTQQPVFVFGLPRSGTTLIEQVLASHPKIHGAGELQLAHQTFESMPTVLRSSYQPFDCVPLLDSIAIASLAERHLSRLCQLDSRG